MWWFLLTLVERTNLLCNIKNELLCGIDVYLKKMFSKAGFNKLNSYSSENGSRPSPNSTHAWVEWMDVSIQLHLLISLYIYIYI